jgi:glutamine cyclotransferase
MQVDNHWVVARWLDWSQRAFNKLMVDSLARSMKPGPTRWSSRVLAIATWVLVWMQTPQSVHAVTAVHTFKVIATYPHDTSAFTQGLLIHQGRLIEGTGGYHGDSSLRRVDMASGTIQWMTQLAWNVFGEGIAVGAGKLIQLTWQNQQAFIYDPVSLEQVGSFGYEGQGWGLTFDGQRFIMSDGSSLLSWRDPASFKVVKSLQIKDAQGPVMRLNELEWVAGQIWANQWQTDRVARIDPETGQVMAWLDLEGLYAWQALGDPDAVLNGIAYDDVSNRLLVTGKNWPWLYEIETAPKGTVEAAKLSVRIDESGAVWLSFPSFKDSLYRLDRLLLEKDKVESQSFAELKGTGHLLQHSLLADDQGASFYRVVGLPAQE